MKKLVIGIFLLGNCILLNANKTYSIDDNEYKQYKDNPKEMLSLFKKKFLKIQEEKKKEEKVVVQAPIIKKDILEQKVITVPKVKKIDLKSNSEEIILPLQVKKKNIKKYKVKEENKKVISTKKEMVVLSKKVPLIQKKIIKRKISSKKYSSKVLIPKTKTVKIKKKTKENKHYIISKVIKKLNYTNIQKEKNIENLIRKINLILVRKNISYDSNEMGNVLKNINSNKMSSFESNIYLKQIVNLIKG